MIGVGQQLRNTYNELAGTHPPSAIHIRSDRKQEVLTLIYPAHFEDVPCQSGVNHIYVG